MESSDEKVDAEESHDHGYETEYHQVCGLSAAPSHGKPVVNHDGVNDPGDKRPGFFWIPVPGGTPGGLSPDRAGNNTDGEKGKAIGHAPVVYPVKGFE